MTNTETFPDPVGSGSRTPPAQVGVEGSPPDEDLEQDHDQDHDHDHDDYDDDGLDEGEGGRRLLYPFTLLVVGVALGWSYFSVFRWLWRFWVDDPNYSHGFLVIPVAALIVWRRGKRASTLSTHPRPWAWLLLVAVLGARAFLYERGNQWGEAMTLLPALGCLVLTLGGWGMLQRTWPAIAFLVFMIPLQSKINGLLSGPLQTLATSGSVSLLRLTGLWVIAEGNVIYVGEQPLEVATACNGLSMLMCLSATVVAAVLLVPMPGWLRSLLVLSAVPIALVSNILRIVATAWCFHRFGHEVGAKIAHDGAGWLMMPTALILVTFELWLISRLLIVEEISQEPTILGRPIRKSLDRPGIEPRSSPPHTA